MTVSKQFLNSIFLAIFVLFSTVPVALAHESTTSFLPASLNSWTIYGSPSVSSDKVTIEGSQREWAYIDIDARDIDSAYILLAAYADKSDNRSSYSSSDRSRSGNPYLYAYYMDVNGKIQKYLTGLDTKTTTRSDSDYVVYGIFPNLSGTKTIRVFLKQSSVKNISNSGADVSFMKPILIETTSNSRAMDLLNAYAAQSLDISTTNATTTSGPGSTTGSGTSTTSCAGSRGTQVFKIGFESNESRDNNLKFGSSLPAWYYGSPDYNSAVSPFDRTTTAQSYAGSTALGLSNASYGYIAGQASTSPQLYDEALRYIATNKLEKNATYAFSIRAKYLQGTSNQSSVSFYLSQETGSDGNGQIVATKLVNANDSWNCQEYEFINRQSTSTVQDLVVFFGSLPRGSTLYIDEIQLIKK